MDSLYLETNGLLQQLQANLATFERSAKLDQAENYERTISNQLQSVSANCDRMEGLVNKEIPARRRNAKYRVDQLRYDYQHLKVAFENVRQKRQTRLQNEAARDELFARRTAGVNGAIDTSIDFDDAALSFHSQVNTSRRRLDELLDSGTSILDNLRSQHVSLKGVQRRILDVANTLGLSTTVMRLIERRTAQDKVILFGGMIVTCIIMIVIYMWLKGSSVQY